MTTAQSDRSTSCCVCDRRPEPFGKARILGKYNVTYYRCAQCGFVQTESPYWLDEAYANPIATTDLGLLGRNYRLARIAARLAGRILKTDEPCVDYGGGYGVFVRLMRDRGLPFYHLDPMADNLFAQHFQANPDDRFALATAFEVFEHLVHPQDDLKKLDQLAPHWLITTELVPDTTPDLSAWWYYMPETGQHISFYSRRSLDYLAEQYGRRVVSCGRGLHFFTTSDVPDWKIRWVMRDRTSRWFDGRIKRKSLLSSDYSYVLECLQAKQKAA